MLQGGGDEAMLGVKKKAVQWQRTEFNGRERSLIILFPLDCDWSPGSVEGDQEKVSCCGRESARSPNEKGI